MKGEKKMSEDIIEHIAYERGLAEGKKSASRKNGIETIVGNLLDFPPYHTNDPNKYIGINNIAHSCNTLNIMGGGIAKQIKSRYPQAYEADTEIHMRREYETLDESVDLLGTYSKAEIKSMFLPDERGRIYNMYTQANIGADRRQVNYEAFYRALKEVQEDLLFIQHETGQSQVLGLPHGISCGLAGGNWDIIKAMIDDIFVDCLVNAYVVKFVV